MEGEKESREAWDNIRKGLKGEATFEMGLER